MRLWIDSGASLSITPRNFGTNFDKRLLAPPLMIDQVTLFMNAALMVCSLREFLRYHIVYGYYPVDILADGRFLNTLSVHWSKPQNDGLPTPSVLKVHPTRQLNNNPPCISVPSMWRILATYS